jgi:hypothetical protein
MSMGARDGPQIPTSARYAARRPLRPPPLCRRELDVVRRPRLLLRVPPLFPRELPPRLPPPRVERCPRVCLVDLSPERFAMTRHLRASDGCNFNAHECRDVSTARRHEIA